MDKNESISNWQAYINKYILPNHSQWNDHAYAALPPSAIKRYLIATHWSVARGPTILGRKESSVETVTKFLAFFPTVQSTIYIIVELQREDQTNDVPSPNLRLGGNSAKEKQKENTPTIKTEPAENFDIVTSSHISSQHVSIQYESFW